MAKNNAFLARLEANYKAQSDELLRMTTLINRQQMLDKVTIALGRMGFNGDDLKEFARVYAETEQDFCEEIIESGKDEPKTELQKSLYMCEAKDKIDRALRDILNPEDFIPYEERYAT